MSYEIVKAIKINKLKQEVWIKSDSNNVSPKSFNWWNCVSLSKMLKEEGLKEVEIAILKDYEEGTFQGVKNKYYKAIERLIYLFSEEYKPFKWGWKADNDDLRNSQGFKNLLWKAYTTKNPKQKYLLYDKNRNAYVYKITTRHISFTNDKENAKTFNT